MKKAGVCHIYVPLPKSRRKAAFRNQPKKAKKRQFEDKNLESYSKKEFLFNRPAIKKL